jgi:enamine deaminase RidA (YjgF/YER057c/UK114 family)
MSTKLISSILVVATLAGCSGTSARTEEAMKGTVSYLNPEGLHKNPVCSPAVVVSGPARTVYVGGQNGVDTTGTVVAKADIAAQAAQTAKNLQIALAAAGARAEHIVKWNIHVVQCQSPEAAMGAFQNVIGPLPNPPTITVLYVAALAHPDFLIEVVVPEGRG